jgi:diguanylate cyclase (GGDEF)-like protein
MGIKRIDARTISGAAVLLAGLCASSWLLVRYDRDRARALRESARLRTELGAERTRVARAQELVQLAHRLRAAAAELEATASTDGLTGLATRRRFDEALADEWRRAARTQQPLSLLMVDVDHFKAYNDLYGHPAGDTCLRQVASQLLSFGRRPGDLAARYGGEEFVLLLPGAEPAGAAALAKRACEQVASLAIPHGASTVGPHVTVSIGVATASPAMSDAATGGMAALVAAADAALYRAKEQGRARFVAAPLAC